MSRSSFKLLVVWFPKCIHVFILLLISVPSFSTMRQHKSTAESQKQALVFFCPCNFHIPPSLRLLPPAPSFVRVHVRIFRESAREPSRKRALRIHYPTWVRFCCQVCSIPEDCSVCTSKRPLEEAEESRAFKLIEATLHTSLSPFGGFCRC